MSAGSGASRGRVDFAYDVEVYGAAMRITPPFVVGVLADLSGPARAGERPPLSERRFVLVDRDNVHERLAQVKPAVDVSLPDEGIDPSRRLRLTFESLDDFAPAGIATRLEPLRPALEARTRIRELRDTLIARSAFPHLHDELRQAVEMLPATPGTHVAALLQAGSSRRSWTADELTVMLATVDDWLGAQVGFVLHQPAFQRLEAAWRALVYLSGVLDTSDTLKLLALDVTKSELMDDSRKAKPALTETLAKEHRTFGGEPLALLAGEMSFSAEPADVELLASLSRSAQSSHATFLAAAAPELLNCDDFGELHGRRRLATLFNSPSHQEWRRFVRSSSSQSVALLLPRVVGRDLHVDSGIDSGFRFEEHAATTGDQLWISPAFVVAARIAQVLGRDNWWWTDGIGQPLDIDHLATFDCVTSPAGVVYCCPVETPLSDELAAQVESFGCVPLRHREGTDSAFVGALRSVGAGADASGAGNADLPSWLNLCLIVRHLRCHARDVLSRFQSVTQLADVLNDWLQQYVQSDQADAAGPRPLAAADVRVETAAYGRAWLVASISFAGGAGQPVETVHALFTVDMHPSSAPG